MQLPNPHHMYILLPHPHYKLTGSNCQEEEGNQLHLSKSDLSHCPLPVQNRLPNRLPPHIRPDTQSIPSGLNMPDALPHCQIQDFHLRQSRMLPSLKAKEHYPATGKEDSFPYLCSPGHSNPLHTESYRQKLSGNYPIRLLLKHSCCK